MMIKGPGEGGVFDLGKVEIEFSTVSDGGECQLPDAFNGSKILFLAKVSRF